MTKLTSIYCLLGKSTSYLFVGFHTQPGLQIFAGLQETQDTMVHFLSLFRLYGSEPPIGIFPSYLYHCVSSVSEDHHPGLAVDNPDFWLSILTLHQLHFNVDDHSSINAIVVTWSASHPCEHRSHLGCPPWSCYHDIMSSLLTHIISLISNKHWPWYWWRKLLLFLGITALLKFVTIVCDGIIFHEDDGNSEKEDHLHTLTMECE